MSAHALAVLQDFHEHTWFSMELLPGVTSSVRGCTAGNPVADLIYIASDTLLARKLHEDLHKEGLSHLLSDTDALFSLACLAAQFLISCLGLLMLMMQ